MNEEWKKNLPHIACEQKLFLTTYLYILLSFLLSSLRRNSIQLNCYFLNIYVYFNTKKFKNLDILKMKIKMNKSEDEKMKPLL